MVRPGIAIYGLSPFDDATSAALGLRPALELSAAITSIKRVPAGAGVSYGYAHRTPGDCDARPRAARLRRRHPALGIGLRAPVSINGTIYRVAGRIAMDQFVVDLGSDVAAVGDRAILFGDPATGVPSADDWAAAAGTINYEIVTAIGPHDAHLACRDHPHRPDAGAMERRPDRPQLRAGDLVALNGELGAGKTTMTRGLGAALGVRGAVTSPTFVLARTHPRLDGGAPLVHVDAYRLSSPAELDDLDIDYPASIVVVEWAAGMLDGDRRRIGSTSRSARWAALESERAPTASEPRKVTVTGNGGALERLRVDRCCSRLIPPRERASPSSTGTAASSSSTLSTTRAAMLRSLVSSSPSA